MQLNAYIVWVTFFACSLNTLKPLTLSERLKGSDSLEIKGMSLVQLNTYKSWATFFACRINTLKPLTRSERGSKAIPWRLVMSLVQPQCLQSLGDILRIRSLNTLKPLTL